MRGVVYGPFLPWLANARYNRWRPGPYPIDNHMMRSVALLILATAAAMAAETPAIPPSPSTATGERIWPDPHFTHWPAIMYGDEQRNASFELPVRKAGVTGSVGWTGGDMLPFALPADT